VHYTIADEGPGFDYRRLPDPLNPKSFFQPHGRGLLMIRTFCDEVSWNEKGNEVTLIKYVVPPATAKTIHPSSE
jgi:anti-sigma regulatory factor (Ser/Thr protein kinase)